VAGPERTIDVVLCWHMHQPSYLVSGEFTAPWVYLHGLKDYSDMAAHLESIPGARAVVNFVPVLLDQLEVYNARLARHAPGAGDLGDPLLDALASGRVPEDPAARLELIRSCFQVNEHRVLPRYPRFAELARIAAPLEVDHVDYLSDQFVLDCLVWLHLGWLGESVRLGDNRARRLEAKGHHFDASDREDVIRIVTEELARLVPRYAALAADGKVELSMSPWGHPILPLLLDFEAAREAMPDVALPAAAGAYPDGAARARWHLERGLEVFVRYFGRRPSGCWPPEGALSNDTIGLLRDMGFRWTASGGGVLGNSLAAHGLEPGCSHVPFSPGAGDVRCFFRDDTLSDLMGFAYKDWAAADAVNDLIGRLEGIAKVCDHPNPVVSIILDGENAWEHYQHNGWEFLQLLYSRLAEHPQMRLTTFEALLDAEAGAGHPLPGIVCGSWVYGTLSTWIGDPDKNRAWDQLIEAKREYDLRAGATGVESATAELLAVCEGSDWFWWLGDHHAPATVRRFERLYRSHLRALYGALSAPDPGLDEAPASQGGAGEPGGGTMLPSRRN